MGLAAAKNKRKLGNDPNNTKWSRNTDSFGQKILRAQGWQPGQYLGAKDASHAEWHTEANLAHIKVTLKDDNLGLGAKRNHGDECTGLDAFQHLLGRLNGKSDEALETERKAREDLKLNLYVERKLGTIRFVRGGWLVGDQLKETADEVPESQGNAVSETSSSASDPATRGSRKRKGDQDTDENHQVDDKAEGLDRKSKKRKTKAESEDVAETKDKKSKKRRAESHGDEVEASSSSTGSKRKKDKKKADEDPAQTTSTAYSEAGDISGEVDKSDEAEKVRKQKKDKKKEKGKKKEKKDKSKKHKTAPSPETEAGDNLSGDTKQRKDGSPSEPMVSEEGTSSAPTAAESTISTPSGSGYSTPVPTGSSRYLARSRFIAQKRMAFTDTAALNQIFMIKS
ncbi:uncharacterized protein B0T15DRAFT_45977 [Chaetomium strumarium]|uniref:PinX1-related protein 1 n=1 Tax=Chaetomium strumarium TaxID=1170767 RepID=A0AAJ0M6A9_9PEZI|nr:hypothetical protein B0T15DRAFT_45977 [Chaetomium strumarium]